LLEESRKEEDSEIVKMLEEDLLRLKGSEEDYGEIEEIEEEILDVIIPTTEAEQNDSVILEVMQAAGGSESSLFAEDILNMYKNFARRMSFRFKEESFQKDMAIGKGCKYALCEIEGPESFKYFKHESGVHKVQRVPETEKAGRIHSSTCVVLVMPKVPRDFKIDMNDITIQTKRASGAGGQHVNTTDSAVRVVHNPTGIDAQS
jgi:peptide chain release factor 1